MFDLDSFQYQLDSISLDNDTDTGSLENIIDNRTGFNSPSNEVFVTRSDLPNLEEYLHYLFNIWENNWLTNDGQLVQLLEKRMMDYLGLDNFLAVSNGSSALQIAFKALNIKGRVITTPFTFAATTNTLIWEGLQPVFADIDPETFNLDPGEVEENITSDTSAILAVHTFGNPCDVDKLQKIAYENDLFLIYDGAHAFKVEYKGKPLLEYGDISTLSFHATKAFHTIEGGGLVPGDKVLSDKIRLLRNHGIASEEEVILPGINAKMNEFQASMGLCNLNHIDQNLKIRKILYECYKQNLEDLDLKFQKITASSYNHAYMPLCFEDEKTRNLVFNTLNNQGYHSRKYFYPLTVDYEYFQNKTVPLFHKNDLECARQISSTILCLPLYPTLSLDEMGDIINIIQRVLN